MRETGVRKKERVYVSSDGIGVRGTKIISTPRLERDAKYIYTEQDSNAARCVVAISENSKVQCVAKMISFTPSEKWGKIEREEIVARAPQIFGIHAVYI